MIERRTLKDGSVRWKARIKSGGEVIAQQTFRLKGDAETWEREQIRALQLGTFLPPKKARTPLGEVVVTVARLRTSLSALFTYAMREKYVASHPVRGVEFPPGASQKPADEWFTAESLAAALEAQRASSEHYAAITE